MPPAINWLKGPFGRPARLLSQVFAFSASSRQKANSDPLYLLVPCFTDALITAPAALPNSAEYVRVWTLNSCSASTGGATTCGLRSCRLVENELLSAPSSM